MQPVLGLDGVIQHYAWGSRSVIPTLLGRPPDAEPAAELWFGDHVGAPSPVPENATTLDAVIAADPERALGRKTVERFGPRLPFLIKVLAADRALSIQVHPNSAQARAGFAAEEAAGVPRDAPERNYGDPFHKPELLCALAPFDALCGFRPVSETLGLLDELAVPELGFVADLLGGADPLRAAVTAALRHPEPAVLADAVSRRLDGSDERLRGVALAAGDCPGDIGVVLALLLNHVRLEPGEAIFLGAGNVHAYLRGTGVEIMASSDNVLRCGLTAKHIAVAELLATADFTASLDPQCRPVPTGDVWTYPAPVEDFRLVAVDLDAGARHVPVEGPCIVLSVERTTTVEVADGSAVVVERGRAAFVAAGAEVVTIRGGGRAFLATLGYASRQI